MKEVFFCPYCSKQLERLYSCGAEGYVCNNCRQMVSRKAMISEKEMVEKVVKHVVETLSMSE